MSCLQQSDHSAVQFDHFFILHFFDLAHHGAAVDAEIICQFQQGEGQLKGQAVLFGGLDTEITHQFAADGAVAEDIHLFRQVNHFVTHQLQHIFHYLRMVLAGVGVALGDVLFFDEQHGAVLFADSDEFILSVGESEGIAKYTGILQIFQEIQRAVDTDAADRNSPFQKQTDVLFFPFYGGDDVFFGERTLLHVEAGHHFFDAFGRNILKQCIFRNIFHIFLLSVAFATTNPIDSMIP